MASEKLPVVLLDDLPASDDAFGGHQGVANAILELITTERGGRSIALVGDWGSGKSTVVKLIEKMAAGRGTSPEESDTEVFVFDAWAHEGDPLRRSYLERLIKALQKKRWIDKARWDRKLEELSKRRRTTDTRSSPHFTAQGIALLALLYLAPIAVAIIAESQNFYHKQTVLWAAIALYLLPLAVLVVYRLCSRSGPNGSLASLWGLLFNQTVERTTTDTFETPEPTSVEFQDYFHDLAQEAVGAVSKDRRNLLLVIDNLDRVEVPDALKLWSSMSTFIENGRSAEWTQNVWTLVPFDEDGIKRLRNHGQTQTGEAFLAKTFQVRFAVPPPLLSDWSSFLTCQLRKAFPKHEQREFYRITRIYSLLCVDAAPPNPRDLKNFINQIGTTYRSHADPIPLALHGLLAALTYKGKAWKPGTPIPQEEELRGYIGPDWLTQLAALYFNASRDKALQAVFGAQLETQLVRGDSKGLSTLAQNPGIDQVILQIVTREIPRWLKSESFRIGRAANACEPAKSDNSDVWLEVWHKLGSAAKDITSLPVLDESTGKGFAVLIVREKDSSLPRSILRSLAATNPPEKGDADWTLKWISGAWEILSVLLARGSDELIKELFSVGKNTAAYLTFLQFPLAAFAGGALLKHLRPKISAAEVIGALKSTLASGDFSTLEIPAENMIGVDAPWNWAPLAEAAANRLQAVNVTIQAVGAIIRTLFRLARTQSEAEQALRGVAQSNWSLHYLWVAESSDTPDAVASCLLQTMMYQPEANNPANVASAFQGRNTYRTYMSSPRAKQVVFDLLVKQATELIPGERLIQQAKASSAPNAMLHEILRAILSGPDASTFLSAKSIVENYDVLRTEIGADNIGTLLRRPDHFAQVIEELSSRPFSTDLIPLYMFAIEAPEAERLRSHLSQELQEFSKQHWVDAIMSGSSAISLLLVLRKAGESVRLGLRFHDALIVCADSTIAGTPPKLSVEILRQLIGTLDADQRETFARHMAEEVAEAESDVTGVIKHFWFGLDDCTFLKEVAEKFVREGLTRILARSQSAELDSVTRVLKSCPEIRQNCAPSSLKTLIKRIDDHLGAKPSQEIASQLGEIRKTLEG